MLSRYFGARSNTRTQEFENRAFFKNLRLPLNWALRVGACHTARLPLLHYSE